MDTEKARRKRLASLPFSEKIKILEKLRERDREIAASGLRKKRVRSTPQSFPREWLSTDMGPRFRGGDGGGFRFLP
jgi:hypothetical protein